MSVRIRIEGLTEYRRALRQIDSGLPGELRAGFGKVAGKIPRITGTAARSVKARASQTGAGVAVGRDVPYYGWLDFGGHRPRDVAVSRPSIRQGRYLYPTIIEESGEIEDAAIDAIETVAREAGF